METERIVKILCQSEVEGVRCCGGTRWEDKVRKCVYGRKRT